MIASRVIDGASVEDTPALLAVALGDNKGRIRPLLTRQLPVSTHWFPDLLPSDKPRKMGWMQAKTAFDDGRWRQQAVLGRVCERT